MYAQILPSAFGRPPTNLNLEERLQRQTILKSQSWVALFAISTSILPALLRSINHSSFTSSAAHPRRDKSENHLRRSTANIHISQQEKGSRLDLYREHETEQSPSKVPHARSRREKGLSSRVNTGQRILQQQDGLTGIQVSLRRSSTTQDEELL